VRWIGGGIDVIDSPPEGKFLLIDEGGPCKAIELDEQLN
jgi:hypothetical protein